MTTNKMVESEIKLGQNGEIAVVRVLNGGRVEVERNGVVTAFRPNHTVETVVTKFKNEGWEETETGVKPESESESESEAESKLKLGGESEQRYPSEIQMAIDEYLELHEQQSEIKAKMEKLKKQLRPFMEDNGYDELYGTKGKKIYLQEAKASNATSRYTDYELQDIMNQLEGNLLRKVTEIRVNAEKLEALLKVEKLPKEKVKEIRSKKIVKAGTPRFSVKK